MPLPYPLRLLLPLAFVASAAPAVAQGYTLGDSSQVTPDCIYAAAVRQQLDPVLYLAVLRQEAGTPGKCVRNKNGTCDAGPAAINISAKALDWLSSVFGMPANHFHARVLHDGCFNVEVGAWMLRHKIDSAGGDVWKGVAWYNSRTPGIGTEYAKKVAAHYRTIDNLIRQAGAYR